jgi:NAD(P)-dependent dehydrogenase (short-subunit alcohol dehydrogenase family)
VEAGASLVLAGVADPWKPFPGEVALRSISTIEIVPLDLTDSRSVAELAAQNGARVDILIIPAAHVRPGGMIDPAGLTLAREDLELRYLGLMRLAQSFGPVMRARGADGVNAAQGSGKRTGRMKQNPLRSHGAART